MSMIPVHLLKPVTYENLETALQTAAESMGWSVTKQWERGDHEYAMNIDLSPSFPGESVGGSCVDTNGNWLVFHVKGKVLPALQIVSDYRWRTTDRISVRTGWISGTGYASEDKVRQYLARVCSELYASEIKDAQHTIRI
jgi:hypothetical protein